jgi:hypothetical protein
MKLSLTIGRVAAASNIASAGSSFGHGNVS